MPPTATAMTTEPSQSRRPVAVSSRVSGTWRRVAQSARAMSGTFTRNATRHEKRSTIRPPTSGPSTVSAEVAAAQMPNARARASPS